MTISAAEQYMIELLNRARMNPVGEAAMNKITLNQGLAANTLGTQVRQVLAPDQALEEAAIGHSQWMLAADRFSHTGNGGTSPGQRASAAGYDWNRVGENIAWQGTTGTMVLEKVIGLQHQALFKSAHHRVNILLDSFREVGISQEAGQFKSGSYNFNASMVTQNFGASGSDVFVTGVAYTDTNKDNFYSIGEGQAGITLSAQGVTDTTKTAGGYALALTAATEVAVTGQVGTLDFSATVALNAGNVKFDVVNATTIFTSGDITLGTGLNDVRLLEAGALDATGNAVANTIHGNSAANVLSGDAGADVVFGGSGNDAISGGADADVLWGDAGADTLLGGSGADVMVGGIGSDRLSGGTDADVMTGGKDKDTFIFMNGDGADRVADYSVRERDVLLLDDALWGGVAMTEALLVKTYARVINKAVVFDFGDGDVLTLSNVRSVSGVAALIDII